MDKNKSYFNILIAALLVIFFFATSFLIYTNRNTLALITLCICAFLILVQYILCINLMSINSSISNNIIDSQEFQDYTVDVTNIFNNTHNSIQTNALSDEIFSQAPTITNDKSSPIKEIQGQSEPSDNKLNELFYYSVDPKKFKSINIIDIAKQAVAQLNDFANKSGILINISSSTDRIIIKADPDSILILFRNIIDNSIKYMNCQGSLVITISNIDTDIFIVLKDSGNGLSTPETEHIFELNYQGSNRVSGNGLGLTQSKAIVNSYGGTIYARSDVGKGMGIYIQIPSN